MLFTPSQLPVLVLALLSTPALAVKNLSVKVEGPASVQDVDNFVIKTVLSNTGDETLTLLKDPESILTPNLKTNVFGITNANGTPAKFDGVKVKWSPSIAINNKEFTVLNPGQSITIEQDLSGTYNLTDSRAGLYTIDAKKEFTLFENGKISKISASDAGVHTLSVEGALSSKIAAARHAASAEALRKRQTYSGCTSSRQSSIASAVPSAQTYINNAISYLNGISSGTTRYTTWFGSYTASRKSTVLSHYNNMSGDPAAGLYDCACTDSSYAYVYPNQPYHIWLCNAFWSAPTTGTDSKAGTIVHELSHFTVNGGTNDYAYGQSAAKNLASSNPSQAIQNADNHEYFAENTPSLP